MAEIKEALNNIEIPSFTKPEIVDKVKNLPENIKSLSSQIAGHDLAIFYDEINKYILKPIFDVRGIREETFYRLLFDKKYDNDPKLIKLRLFLPTYINTILINDVKFIALSDLTAGLMNCSLMDIKIGFKTYDRNATEEKIKHESTKDNLSKLFGFRVLAIKKWIDSKQEYEQVNRDDCRKCSSEDVEKIIKFFLEQSNKSKTTELINSIIKQLNEINNWFNNDNIDLFEFIGSSLFFIYSFKDNKLDCRIKMIDFAHIYQLEGTKINLNDEKKDNNYLLGLNSLTDLITNLLKKI